MTDTRIGPAYNERGKGYSYPDQHRGAIWDKPTPRWEMPHLCNICFEKGKCPLPATNDCLKE